MDLEFLFEIFVVFTNNLFSILEILFGLKVIMKIYIVQDILFEELLIEMKATSCNILISGKISKVLGKCDRTHFKAVKKTLSLNHLIVIWWWDLIANIHVVLQCHGDLHTETFDFQSPTI